jgi:hypothetical protein
MHAIGPRDDARLLHELPVGGERHPLMDERVVAGAGGGGHGWLRDGWRKITILNKIGKLYFGKTACFGCIPDVAGFG